MKMKISWDEPKSSYWPRWKQNVTGMFTSTPWLRIGFWLFIFLPGAIAILQIYHPNPRLTWEKVFLIYKIMAIVIPLVCLIGSTKFIMEKPKVIVDDEGIKLRGPEDGLLCNYSYNKITSISLIQNEFGNLALSWVYKGKTMSRGIPFGVDLNKLQTTIEWNSSLKLENMQS